MLLYILRRLLLAVVLAILVTLITFLLLSPSFDSIVRSSLGTGASAEAVAQRVEDLGLNRPLMVQYLSWLVGAVTGDFGVSIFTNEPVGPAVIQRLGITLSIVFSALLISVIISVTLGVLAATRGGAIDRFAQSVSLTGLLVPSLLVAVFLVFVFAITLGWLPAGGYKPFFDDPGAWAASVTLPVIALAVTGIANMSNQVRGTMIDELRKDYVRTLRSRGISSRSIVYKHALRNAGGPALTVLGFEFLGMLGAALFIERVFALPGYGTFAFNASLRGDLPVILGITLFAVFLTVIVNFVIDIANGILNPKARLY